MSVRARLFLVRLLVTVCVCGGAHAGAADSLDTAKHVDVLRRQALAHSARNTIESRRMAIQCLEEATLLAPDRADLHLELARLYDRCGYRQLARRRFERVADLHPDDPEAWLGLARLWRRDYLKYVETASLDHAITDLREAAALRPGDAEIALNLAPLLVERGDLPDALAAVERARAAAPARNDLRLAEGMVTYHLGQLGRADSAFRDAVPHLARQVRERFEDIAPLATAEDTVRFHRLTPEGQSEFLRRFWLDLDPDLSTAQNEAQLAYFARVAQAYFLYFDTRRREWDERGEVYVRYGPPASSAYNPVGTRNVVRMGSYGVYPMNMLVWDYPDLGMQVVLEDRLLSEYYLLPISMDRDMDPVPNPGVLAQHPERFVTRSGRGVFPSLPPGVKAVPFDGLLARFEGASTPRLHGLLATPGAPGDPSRASMTVLDTARREVVRLSRPLSPSACDPAGLRVADFAHELPPGDYLVGLTVEDGQGGRGIRRASVHLDTLHTVLSISDVVVACGRVAVPEPGADGPPAVRLNANPTAEVGPGRPLTIYFEVYHLRAGTDGLAHFEFEYAVRSAARDPRVWIQRMLAPRPSVPDIAARREDVLAGDLRRQFVEIPVQGLPPGPYRVEVIARDLLAGTETRAAARFVRTGR